MLCGMLLSSTYSAKPLLSTTLRVTKSVQRMQESSCEALPDYYSAEEEQIDVTRGQIAAALDDLKRFLDVGPCADGICASPVHLSSVGSVSAAETRSVFDLLARQSRQLDEMEERMRESQSVSGGTASGAFSDANCFPENVQVLEFLRAFQGCNPALLVNYSDIISFLASRQCGESLGLEFGAQDPRTAYFTRWTRDFEARVIAVLKVKFGDYKASSRENGRSGTLAIRYFAADNGKMSVYQLWLCAIAFWWICGGQYVPDKGLCVGGAVGYAL